MMRTPSHIYISGSLLCKCLLWFLAARQCRHRAPQHCSCRASKLPTHASVNNAGVSEQMLKLGGTIPVRYNKAEYNIPVLFWIGPSYPDKPPIMFVDPTPGLIFRCSITAYFHSLAGP